MQTCKNHAIIIRASFKPVLQSDSSHHRPSTSTAECSVPSLPLPRAPHFPSSALRCGAAPMAANPFAQLCDSDSSSSDGDENPSPAPATKSASKSKPLVTAASTSESVDIAAASEDLSLPTPPDDAWVLEETRRCAVECDCVPCAYKIINSLGLSVCTLWSFARLGFSNKKCITVMSGPAYRGFVKATNAQGRKKSQSGATTCPFVLAVNQRPESCPRLHFSAASTCPSPNLQHI